MSYSFSSPFAADVCTIDVFPFEGGPIFIQGGQIVTCEVKKSIYNGSDGTFVVQLAPGGPDGPESFTTWSQAITPMSHILIGMGRGADAAIVLDGVVTIPTESFRWSGNEQGSTAARGQALVGYDFNWFFTSFNFYALTFYGLTAGTPVGDALSFLPGGLAQFLSQGLVGGADPSQCNPVQVGRLWFQKVMAGPNGILGKTFVPFANDSRLTFSKVMSASWENYPKVYIPYGEFFMISEQSWMEKFQAIFPFPWYEFFVTTAPIGLYTSNGNGFDDGGVAFTMENLPGAQAAGPQLVARVNPVPRFDANILGAASSVVPGSMDVSRWNALPLVDFTQAPFGFMNSDVYFSAEEASNFYQVNPTAYRTLSGTNNANNLPLVFLFIAAADAASIQRYGFRPKIGTTRWFFDSTGTVAQNQSLNITQSILTLTAAYISWFHPSVLMLKGTVTIPLSPGIPLGSRFRYAPYKDNVPWDFYVEGYSHKFVFGGQSSTTLTLCRGLPAEVYADTADDGMLRAVHTGNAMRPDGVYTIGLPDGTGPALQFVTTPDQAAALNSYLANVFVTPQAK